MRPNSRLRSVSLALASIVFLPSVHAAGPNLARPIPVPPPPMGWSSWNSFSNTINAEIVMAQANAMASNGMQKAGYQYINIDEGWWLGERHADGSFVIDEKVWPALAQGEKPGDMANIVRFIHGLGLKAGIYTDAGKDGCSLYPDVGWMYFNTGSEGHYEQDFLQFAKWGFDYVKVDWCGGDRENLDPAVQYAEIARAIARAEKITGHRLYFSLCEWGKQSPWTWAPHVGGAPAAIWRTSGDIVDPIVASGPHADRKASFDKMLGNFDQGVHPEAQHTGFYNDPDMMVIGMPGLTDAQNRVHMSLWAISGAPLLVGADLAKLSPETLAMLTNKEVLAVDQDALGLQAVKAAEPAKGLEVWVKPLAKAGSRAVLLLNRTGTAQEISAGWKDLGLAENAQATVTNLWTGEQLARSGSYAVQVPPGDAVLLLVQGTEMQSTAYQPDPPTRNSANAPLMCRDCDLSFSKVASRSPWAQVRITYKNSGNAPRYAELRVNGHGPTRIAFPPTGTGPGSISIITLLDQPNANVLRFSASEDTPPVIDAITVN
jgi:Alpha galactosidase A/Alpha galactosidase C-terminal beta sandwich domain